MPHVLSLQHVALPVYSTVSGSISGCSLSYCGDFASGFFPSSFASSPPQRPSCPPLQPSLSPVPVPLSLESSCVFSSSEFSTFPFKITPSGEPNRPQVSQASWIKAELGDFVQAFPKVTGSSKFANSCQLVKAALTLDQNWPMGKSQRGLRKSKPPILGKKLENLLDNSFKLFHYCQEPGHWKRDCPKFKHF